jgi:hypothetical protein
MPLLATSTAAHRKGIPMNHSQVSPEKINSSFDNIKTFYLKNSCSIEPYTIVCMMCQELFPACLIFMFIREIYFLHSSHVLQMLSRSLPMLLCTTLSPSFPSISMSSMKKLFPLESASGGWGDPAMICKGAIKVNSTQGFPYAFFFIS